MNDRSGAAAAPVCDSEALSPRLMAAPAAIAGFCKRWRMAELSLFGSVFRGDYNRKSDIDVLVEFESICERYEALILAWPASSFTLILRYSRHPTRSL